MDDSDLYSESGESSSWEMTEAEGSDSDVVDEENFVDMLVDLDYTGLYGEGAEAREDVIAYIQVIRQAESNATPEERASVGGRRQIRSTRDAPVANRTRSSSASKACLVVDREEGSQVMGESGAPITTAFSHYQAADCMQCSTSRDGLHDEILVARSRSLSLYRVPKAGGDAAKSKEIARLRMGFGPYSIARSSCGRFVAAGGSSNLAILEVDLSQQPGMSLVCAYAIRDERDTPMMNSVRFGKVGGRERLFVANQNGFVYIFNVPSEDECEREVQEGQRKDLADSFLSADFYDASHDLTDAEPAQRVRNGRSYNYMGLAGPARSSAQAETVDPVPLIPERSVWSVPVKSWYSLLEGVAEQYANDPRALATFDVSAVVPSMATRERRTNVLGEFPIALNCAVPSPDGKWLAAVGDANFVFLLDMAQVMAGKTSTLRTAPVHAGADAPVAACSKLVIPDLPSGSRILPGSGESGRPDCQYCCWNRSSTYVAASSDNGRLVVVFDVEAGTPVSVFNHHQRPCLPLTFASGCDHTLFWAEDISSSVHAANVAVKGEWELLRLPERDKVKRNHFFSSMMYPHIEGQRITGLAVSDESVYVSTTELVSRHNLVFKWTKERHSMFPKRFRSAAMAVLQGAHGRRGARGGEGCPFALLPEPLLMDIVAASAFPLHHWVVDKQE